MEPSNPEISKQNKQQVWENKRKEIDEIKDALGMGIDEKIKDTIVALNVLGINTVASCEGHTDENRGLPYPWIDFASPNEPLKFEGEKEIYEKTAESYGIPVTDIIPPVKNLEVFNEALFKASQNKITTEWQDWEKENEKLNHKINSYLSDFYSNRETPNEIRINIEHIAPGLRRIQSGDIEVDKPEDELKELISKRQIEMENFTEFLKNKFFQS